MKNSFVHIGYPKSASTALQLGYFNAHPDIFFLGPYNGGHDSEYINENVKHCIEVDIRLTKDFGYDEDRVRSTFENAYSLFEKSGCTAFGLSSESLSFTMHHDVDTTQKADRLFRVFGENLKVVIVIRNQISLIRSFYRQMIAVGLSVSFREYVCDLFYNKHRSFIYDLDYYKMYDLYVGIFGAENVWICPLEMLKRDSEAFLDGLSRHLEVPTIIRSIPTENESQSETFYSRLRELNQRHRYMMGSAVMSASIPTRFPEYFPQIVKAPPPLEVKLERQIADILWKGAMDDTRGQNGVLDTRFPDGIYGWLHAYYAESNAKLADVTGLPLATLNYPYLDGKETNVSDR